MSRAPRIEYEGAVYHVTNRGNGQEMIYREEADWKAFLGIMSDVTSEFGWRIYAYCLMGNHYHLLLETPQPNLSLGMRELDLRYTVRYNKKYERSGHVFQGRYWSGLVLNDNYLIDAASYVLLNPVRAQLVHSPEEWRWSSCAAMAGLVPSPAWLYADWLPVDFRSAPGTPDNPFLSYVQECIGKPRPANLEGQHRRIHRNVKTAVPGTEGVHN
jgi:REP element-mobilizing transposase RayT